MQFARKYNRAWPGKSKPTFNCLEGRQGQEMALPFSYWLAVQIRPWAPRIEKKGNSSLGLAPFNYLSALYNLNVQTSTKII